MADNDEKILKALEDLQAGQEAINKRLNEMATKKDVEEVKDTQQEHGENWTLH